MKLKRLELEENRMEPESGMSNRRAVLRTIATAEYGVKRKQLLDIAADIFKTKGYEATNINEITLAAGIDRATFYYYASSKKGLFQEIVYQTIRDLLIGLEGLMKNPGTPADKLHIFISYLMDSFDRHYPYLFIYIQEDMTKIESEQTVWAREMRRLARKFNLMLIKVIQNGIDSGTFTVKGDARLISFGIIGMLNWSHRWYRPDGGYDHETISQVFIDLIKNGVRTPC